MTRAMKQRSQRRRRPASWVRWLVAACVLWSAPPLALAEDKAVARVGAAGSENGGTAGEGAADDMDKSDGGEEGSWSKGVRKEEREEAKRLLKEGNKHLRESDFRQAAAKYQEALRHWEHPAIYFNLALALKELDQPVEVYKSLERAMKHGPAPLDMVKYERAQEMKDLFERQIAWIEIACDKEGAQVTLDGKQLFVGPGKREVMVRAGEHSVVATKAGYISSTQAFDLDGGARTRYEIKLYTVNDLTRYRRRFPAWVPWTVLTGGVLAAAGGGVLHLQGRSGIQEYDQAIEDCGGCMPTDEQRDGLDSARVKQRVAIGFYAGGGLLALGGLIMVYLNQPESYRINMEESSEQVRSERVRIVPIIGRDTAGVTAAFSF